MRSKVELLCPAGSYEAVLAAIEGGADAVYMGGEFNARAFAKNLDRDEIKDAIRLLHIYGVKAYITLNTTVYERELESWLSYAKYLYECGADAFIVADIGAALALKKYIPDVTLHASTQMSVHNSEGVKTLASLGFERVVVARELSKRELISVCKSECEIEVFVHGALCVSASGQCLMSSLVGDRSGNRGECAQPCRLTYNKKPLLSLRDNCLAKHVKELCEMGVSSFKIEGRMKSADYVYGVCSIYRRLIDECRDATDDEIRELEGYFSRSGFTDGYYTEKKDGMCGIRTESDKKKSGMSASFTSLTKKVPLSLSAKIKAGDPMMLIGRTRTAEASVTGDIPLSAISAPVAYDSVQRSLSKLGSTPFCLDGFSLELDEGLYVSVKALNDLRRALTDKLVAQTERTVAKEGIPPLLNKKQKDPKNTLGSSARFISSEQLKESKITRGRFSRIYLPLSEDGKTTEANGVVLPPVVFDSEWEDFIARLTDAREWAEYAICTNISQIAPATSLGYTVTADFRLNVTNPLSAEILCEMGCSEIILSAELGAAQMRDIHVEKSVITYGKIPVMITEKCPIKEDGGCKVCKSKKPYYLTDRTGARFAVFGDGRHRATIYNSVPTYTADTPATLKKIGDYAPHFIFSDEDGEQIRRICRAYDKNEKTADKIRRIQN